MARLSRRFRSYSLVRRRPGQINAMDNEEFADAVRKTGKRQVVIRYLYPQFNFLEVEGM